MDSTDRGLGGDSTEVEPYGPPRLPQRAVQGVQSSGTDVWVPQAFPPDGNTVRQDRAPSCRSSSSQFQLLLDQVKVRGAQSYTAQAEAG